MPLWKTILSYDGTHLHGWQIQPSLPTVQGHLAGALARITGERVLPQGSGRTDAGVHALRQVASFALAAPIPAVNLHRALNRILPPSIRILSVEPAAPPFHARHSAVSKTYEYRIFPGRPLLLDPPILQQKVSPEPDRICSPMLAPFVWDCPFPLHLPSLQQAAAHILGTHDFTSFAAARSAALDPASPLRPPDDPLPSYPESPPTPCRTIFTSGWTQTPDGLLIYRVTGSGFLHHMVRNLVGSFVLAGSGRLAPECIPAILAAYDRSAAGPTAPARGLFLVEVHYA